MATRPARRGHRRRAGRVPTPRRANRTRSAPRGDRAPMVSSKGLKTDMRALVWIIEDTWQATVAEAARFLPSDAEITLLHVASTEPETVARAARRRSAGPTPTPTASRSRCARSPNRPPTNYSPKRRRGWGAQPHSRRAADASNARSWPPRAHGHPRPSPRRRPRAARTAQPRPRDALRHRPRTLPRTADLARHHARADDDPAATRGYIASLPAGG